MVKIQSANQWHNNNTQDSGDRKWGNTLIVTRQPLRQPLKSECSKQNDYSDIKHIFIVCFNTVKRHLVICKNKYSIQVSLEMKSVRESSVE